MADFRCPECGKLTPIEMEKCLYCGAPLAARPASSAAEAQPPDLGLSIPPSGGTPSSSLDDKAASPGWWSETTFSMEAPELITKPQPEQSIEKGVVEDLAQGDFENPEPLEIFFQEKTSSKDEILPEPDTQPGIENLIIEKKGPLSGLQGVLPAGSGAGRPRTSLPYAAGLRISEEHKRHTDYLERLMAGETQPAEAGMPRRLPSSRLWRWCMAVLLVLAVGLPFASGTPISSTALSSDQGATARIIDGLSAGLPVLVAVDYEPALSGELEAVAAPVMNRLFVKGIPLALISTNPTGPALAERLVQDASRTSGQKYQSRGQYVNLGYLAGGPAGMSYFAHSPTQAMPVTVTGDSAWTTGPLLGIRSLSNFAAILLLTDNADTGRNWIEQVSQQLGSTPILMIVSTQAAPMFQPYFDSAQIKGLVSGLSDAKIYEEMYSRPGLAFHYWNSYSAGMLVAECLLVLGAIWSVLARRRAHSQDPREAG